LIDLTFDKIILDAGNHPRKSVADGQLQHDIAETTRVKTSFVREAKSKENRFMTLLTGMNTLFNDATLVELLVKQKLDKRPALAGDFRFEQVAETEVQS